jgi:hypothetical protein
MNVNTPNVDETVRLAFELPPVLIAQIAEAVAARLTGLDGTFGSRSAPSVRIASKTAP